MELSDKIGSIYEQYKIEALFFAGSMIILLLSSLLFLNQYKPIDKPQITFTTQKPTPEVLREYVDISGAVMSPDLYMIKPGMRLKEVIDKSGGLADNADLDFFHRNFNLARIVHDQEKYYIPTRDEVTTSDIVQENTMNSSVSNIENSDGMIHINDASKEELESISGIGPSTAERIISNRPYQSIEDLLQKKVVNKTVFENIKNNAQI